MKIALETFIPSASQTPGRLNLFQFENFSILLDYAHNPAGMRALQQFTDSFDATEKIGIIAGVGDRREEDTNELGRIAAERSEERRVGKEWRSRWAAHRERGRENETEHGRTDS